LEQRLIPSTSELNSYPLRVNHATWQRNLDAAEESARFWIHTCQQEAKDELFRPNSTEDCRKALGLPPGTSTDADTLADLALKGSKLAPLISVARTEMLIRGQLRKWGGYARAGAVQPHWDSMGTPHGRYSSENPCLNNRVSVIRETVEADEGCSFLSFDLSQAEYVVWASLSKDPTLCTAFESGQDFHTGMAELVQREVPPWNPPDLRAAGKTINFALLYMMQVTTLAYRLGCPVETAARISSIYFKRAARAKEYITETLTRAKSEGFIETYFGRRRYCPELQVATDQKEVHQHQKSLWNHHIAGTAAEITKWKQVRACDGLRMAEFSEQHARLCFQGYDACIWHVNDQYLDDVRSEVEERWNLKEERFLCFKSKVRVGKTLAAVTG
jgi:DNA polymerase-1